MIVFQKLPPEAGAQAAQNERLPLQSIAPSSVGFAIPYAPRFLTVSLSRYTSLGGSIVKPSVLLCLLVSCDNYASLRRENRELKLELARLLMRLNDLEKDHVCMKKNVEKSYSHKFMGSFAKKMGTFRSKL